MVSFEKESIPDSDRLFRRIDPGHYSRERDFVSPNAFKKRETSVNWEKYSTPESTAREDTAMVMAITAGACRVIGQRVEHDPISDPPHGPNQAHSLVIGHKGGEGGGSLSIKQQLLRGAVRVWIRPD